MFQKLPYYIWILSIVFIAAFGVMYLDHFRMYRSQVDILIIHKNEKTSASADQVVNNVAEIPKTLSFYNRLLKQFPEIHDAWVGMSDTDRQEEWNAYVHVERIDKSGIIRLEVDAANKEDAAMLVEKSKQNLFQIIGQYYDIKNELDIRAVNGPITNAVLYSPIGWVISTLASGLVATLILIGAFRLINQKKNIFLGKRSSDVAKNMFQEEKRKPAAPFAPPIAVTFPLKGISIDQSSLPQKPVTASLPSTPFSEKGEVVKQEAAQGDLPFLEEGLSLEQYLFGKQEEVSQGEVTDIFDDAEKRASSEESNAMRGADQKSEDKQITADKETIARTVEPTKEELKQRLNQLLRGEDIQ